MKDHPGPRQTWESDRDYDARFTMWDRSVAAEGVGNADTLTEERIPVELQLAGITSETPTEGETNMSTIAETTIDRTKTDELKAALAEAEQQQIRDLQEAGRKVITCKGGTGHLAHITRFHLGEERKTEDSAPTMYLIPNPASWPEHNMVHEFDTAAPGDSYWFSIGEGEPSEKYTYCGAFVLSHFLGDGTAVLIDDLDAHYLAQSNKK